MTIGSPYYKRCASEILNFNRKTKEWKTIDSKQRHSTILPVCRLFSINQSHVASEIAASHFFNLMQFSSYFMSFINQRAKHNRYTTHQPSNKVLLLFCLSFALCVRFCFFSISCNQDQQTTVLLLENQDESIIHNQKCCETKDNKGTQGVRCELERSRASGEMNDNGSSEAVSNTDGSHQEKHYGKMKIIFSSLRNSEKFHSFTNGCFSHPPLSFLSCFILFPLFFPPSLLLYAPHVVAQRTINDNLKVNFF